MNVQEQLNQNTFLYYVEATDENEIGETGITIANKYELSLSYFDCEYQIELSRENINKDNNIGMLIRGDSKLLSSFEELCENELWYTIKDYCCKYDSWNNTKQLN